MEKLLCLSTEDSNFQYLTSTLTISMFGAVDTWAAASLPKPASVCGVKFRFRNFGLRVPFLESVPAFCFQLYYPISILPERARDEKGSNLLHYGGRNPSARFLCFRSAGYPA
jgi:hypothetical protein